MTIPTTTKNPLTILAGIISSFFGIGGGIIFVPLMVVGMGMAMKKAGSG